MYVSVSYIFTSMLLRTLLRRIGIGRMSCERSHQRSSQNVQKLSSFLFNVSLGSPLV